MNGIAFVIGCCALSAGVLTAGLLIQDGLLFLANQYRAAHAKEKP